MQECLIERVGDVLTMAKIKQTSEVKPFAMALTPWSVILHTSRLSFSIKGQPSANTSKPSSCDISDARHIQLPHVMTPRTQKQPENCQNRNTATRW